MGAISEEWRIYAEYVGKPAIKLLLRKLIRSNLKFTEVTVVVRRCPGRASLQAGRQMTGLCHWPGLETMRAWPKADDGEEKNHEELKSAGLSH